MRNEQEIELGDGWRNMQGRPKRKMPKTQIRGELANAVNQVVEASAAGDVNASIAVLAMSRVYDLN